MTTQYVDFLINPVTRDLDFGIGNSLQLVTTNQVSLRQRLDMRFAVWFGDWFFDDAFGFPYRTFVGQKTMKAVLDGRIRDEVRKERDVTNIIDFQSTFDRVRRAYSCFFTVVTEEGDEINLAFQGLDYSYPTPPEGNVELCGDEQTIIEFKNKLYYLINFQLPVYGDLTWINKWSN